MARYKHSTEPPLYRPLKIFAFDPTLAREPGSRITIGVPNEELEGPGIRGARVEVVDYDGAENCFYPAIDLDDPSLLMRGGMDPDVSDPRFHQQMVYAVAMKVLENFEAALGRTISLRKHGRALRIFPHAFRGANAFYDRDLRALLFGYFPAGSGDLGPNMFPGQTVFTCLSHDVIAHEMTHALVDRLRDQFLEPTNPDVLAFHEGFADVVALFQHFTFGETLTRQIQQKRTDLRQPTLLVQLARQFGRAVGIGQSLRSALDVPPDAKAYQSSWEPHKRGSIMVAAVFDAFFTVYQRRIRDLIRIATGGTGTLPEGDLHPDLVNRVAYEATETATAVLRMCIRAFEYLPPVDVTFGDYLRALITADYELSVEDPHGLRAAMIEGFRARGIYPEGVPSLDEESLLWRENPDDLPPIKDDSISFLVADAAGAFGGPAARRSSRRREIDEQKHDAAAALHAYATTNAERLGLCTNSSIRVHGFHAIFRVGRDRRLLVEVVVQYTQERNTDREFGGLPFRGGATVIFSADGNVRYVIAKPVDFTSSCCSAVDQAEKRYERQRTYARHCALSDPHFACSGDPLTDNYMQLRMNLAAIHRGCSR